MVPWNAQGLETKGREMNGRSVSLPASAPEPDNLDSGTDSATFWLCDLGPGLPFSALA